MLRRLRIENLVLIREAEFDFAAGLNAVTGETGAGKTIFAQAIGLLLGTRGDQAAVGPAGEEAYVEAELDVPEGLLEADEEELGVLAGLRPVGEPGLVLARRVFADGRTRAYAWGRAVAREDLAAAAERLLAMSGQFEQRRLARPSYQLETLDGFCGAEQLARRLQAREAWRELAAARRRHAELSRDDEAATARLAELRALVEGSDGIELDEEASLRAERGRLLHATELAAGVAAAVQAIAPEEGEGAASLAASGERALRPVEDLIPELAASVSELRELVVRLREAGSDLHRVLASLEADPGRLEQVEERLERIAEARRRFRCATTEELLECRAAALAELERLGDGRDPVKSAAGEVATAQARYEELAAGLRASRSEAADRFAAAVTAELHGLGFEEGELRVELRQQDPGPSGADEAAFLIRANRGLPFGPIAEIASGGELSRIALALAAVGISNGPRGSAERSQGPQTLVFDEIDTGIGGKTAHRVAETLQRLSELAQVVTITHLPQIASVAERHFRVEKVPGDPTHTRIEALDEAERRDELERMLGGREFLATVAGSEKR